MGKTYIFIPKADGHPIEKLRDIMARVADRPYELNEGSVTLRIRVAGFHSTSQADVITLEPPHSETGIDKFVDTLKTTLNREISWLATSYDTREYFVDQLEVERTNDPLTPRVFCIL